jgi:polyketide biosynthesis acyl carrier protein
MSAELLHARVLAVVKSNICAVLPELDPDTIAPDARLVDLGANSIDRADIVVQSMADLDLRVAPGELSRAQNIGGLVALFVEHLARA